MELLNFPGFNDVRELVNNHVQERLNHSDVFIFVVDINRGVSNTDVQILESLKQKCKPILVCLNKCDLPRPNELDALKQTAYQRLIQVDSIIETILDPDPRLASNPQGTKQVSEWVLKQIEVQNKNTAGIIFNEKLF